MARRRANLAKSSFLSHNDYARALFRSGGPGFDDLGHLGDGAGLYAEFVSGVWDASLAEFNAMCAGRTH